MVMDTIPFASDEVCEKSLGNFDFESELNPTKLDVMPEEIELVSV